MARFFPILRDSLLIAFITCLALSLAYQIRSRLVIDVGASRDELFVRDFFGVEGDGTQSYRWTHRNSEIELEGQQLATPLIVEMRLNGYRPNRSATVQLAVNETALGEFQAAGDWRKYQFSSSAATDIWNGTTTLRLTSDVFVPQNFDPNNPDARRLGVAVDWLEIAPVRSGATLGSHDFWFDFGQAPVVPPLLIVLSCAGAFGILYATARGIGLPARSVNLVFAILLVPVALGFAFARFYLAPFAYTFLNLAVALALIALGLGWVLPRIAQRLTLTLDSKSATVLSAIVLLSMGLKWGGVWFPNFKSSDLLFHAHRLEYVWAGNVFFTSELPDAARRVVPYPPALYVLLAPFAPFTREFETLLLLANVLCDALAILTLYFAARRIFALPSHPRTGFVRPRFHTHFALFAAFLFAFNPVSFWIYSWGNHTNIFGELAATLLFCMLLTQYLAQSLVRPRNFVVGLFLIALASMAHLGIFLSLLAFFPVAIGLRFFARDENAKRESIALALLFLAGIAAASILYYSEFAQPLFAQTQMFLNDFGAGRAATQEGITLERVSDVLRYTWEQVGWVLLLAGIVGIPLAWKNFAVRPRTVWLAWLIVGLVFGLVTIGSSFSTRYTLWAAPALALSGGLLLAWFFEKSRPAQFVVYALCAFALAQTLWLWVDRVLNAYQ